eukprot:TRINITY_DN4007_c0_g1_i1.p1 TRINITY_DN4007_c0_g1~~TRINITY_DN4007_c0_g1_i1.p1  ORF type:complete len:1563 (+),score=556.93 TRINITY_DN4007_c0_g1_i1:97-4785(+)
MAYGLGPQAGMPLGQDSRGLLSLVGDWVSDDVLRQEEAQLKSRRDEQRGADDPHDQRSRKGPFFAPVFLPEKTLPMPWDVRQGGPGDLNRRVKMLGVITRIAAWRDAKLVLWNYESGRDRSCYTASAAITEVVAAPAPPAVFDAGISHVLAVATADAVELVGITVHDTAFATLTLTYLNAGDSRVSTNAVMVKGAAHHATQRIFFGGNDSCVYELQMRPREGVFAARVALINRSYWFSGAQLPGVTEVQDAGYRIIKQIWPGQGIIDVQVDQERALLYTLSPRGQISAWNIGRDRALTAVSGSPSVDNAVSIHIVPKSGKGRGGSSGAIMVVLKADGQRQQIRGSFDFGRSGDWLNQLQTGAMSMGGIAGQPLQKAYTAVSGGEARMSVHGLAPSGLRIQGAPQGVWATRDGRTVRSAVSSSSCLLVPRVDTQRESDLLVGIAPVATDTAPNCLAVVDLAPVWQAEPGGQGLEVDSVDELPWAGEDCGLQLPQHDLLSQVLRPIPRYLVAHSMGATTVVRLRPLELVHAALLEAASRRPGAPPRPDSFSTHWLRELYGEPEYGVILLSLIARGHRSPAEPQRGAARPSGPAGGHAELQLAATLAAPPTQPVVETAKREFQQLLHDRGGPGYCSLFWFYARVVKPLWALNVADASVRKLMGRPHSHIFLRPLEGLLAYLESIAQAGAGLERRLPDFWDPRTDDLLPGVGAAAGVGVAVHSADPRDKLRELFGRDSYYTNVFQVLNRPTPTGQPPIAPEVVQIAQHLALLKLRDTVELTVQLCRVLRSLEMLPQHAQDALAAQLHGDRTLSLHLIATQAKSRAGLVKALMGELLRNPAQSGKIWAEWSRCRWFFDPAAAPVHEARRFIAAECQGAAGGRGLGEALRSLHDPEVARRVLGINMDFLQYGRVQQQEDGDTIPRIQTICGDLRGRSRFRDALELAAAVARRCDEGDLAVKWHASQSLIDLAHTSTLSVATLQQLERFGNHFYNARVLAYKEVAQTLTSVLEDDTADVAQNPQERTERVEAVRWAFGAEAAAFYERGQTGRRPTLGGQVFNARQLDPLLLYSVLHWMVQRPDPAKWPARPDAAHALQRVVPAAAPGVAPTAEADHVKLWLSGGNWQQLAQSPTRAEGSPQRAAVWQQFWPGWHAGLYAELADYCSVRGEHRLASAVALALAHAPHAMLASCPDVRAPAQSPRGAGHAPAPAPAAAAGGALLQFRARHLERAADFASRDRSDAGRKLQQQLAHARYAEVAQVQLELLGALPEVEACLARADDKRWVQQDRQRLSEELLFRTELYEILHDSYAEYAPQLALRLLRLGDVERPQQRMQDPAHPPLGVSDFVSKYIRIHLSKVRLDTVGATVRECLRGLMRAAGAEGLGAAAESVFFPLSIIMSGLEEIAMAAQPPGTPIVPTAIAGPRAAPVSPVPAAIAQLMGWPQQKLLYTGYLRLLEAVGAGHDTVHPEFRSRLSDAHRLQALVRVSAILAQLFLEWADHHRQALHRADAGWRRSEVPDFIGEVALRLAQVPDVPEEVCALAGECEHRQRQLLPEPDAAAPAAKRARW